MNQEQSPPGYVKLDIDGFRSKLNSSLCSIDCSIAGRANSFSTSLEGVRLGSLDLLRYDGYGLRGGRRSFRQIREDEIDDFLVVLPLTIPVAISQSGRSTIVKPGACVFLTTARPFEGLCGAPPSYTYSEFVVRIPGPLLRQYVPYIDDCCARPITVSRGTGKILRSLIETLIEERTDYSESQANRFGTILLGTVTNVALDAPEWADLQFPSQQSAHSRVFECAKDFIKGNLSNPALDPTLVANHCNISVSYLHAAFAASSLRVSTFIREMRLQRCREALQSPSLRNKSIIEIAMGWGFNSSSGFNRAYHARFGKSPSADRILSLLAPLPGDRFNS